MTNGGELSKLIRDEFANQMVAIREELRMVREEIKLLGESTTDRIETCEKRIAKVEGDILEIKRRTLKNNIVIFGLKLDSSDILHSVITQLNSLLEIDLQEVEINNIYNIGKNKSIIKVEFVSFLSKTKVTSNRFKLKGSRIFVNDDLCKEDRENLKLLRQQLASAKANDHKAYIRKNCLVVDGEKFSIEQLKERKDTNLPATPAQKKTEKLSSKVIVDPETTTSAPSNPAPFARHKQFSNERDYLVTEEQLETNKEISSIIQVSEITKDWEELSRTRSQSSGSIKGGQKTGSGGSKARKGGKDIRA